MRTYRIFNLVVLGLLLYVLVFSLVSPALEDLFPSVVKCYYKEFTGDPCPFCGLTRDMNCVLTGEGGHDRVNTRFQIFLSIYVLELALRIFLVLASKRLTGRTLPAVDIAIHCILALIVLRAFNTV